MRRHRRTAIAALIAVTALSQSGCGTLLHPERSGQSPGRIDPAIAILDGIGLLFYLVPGLVAFAVDFSNNTIYLPSGGAALDEDGPTRAVRVDGPLDRDAIEAVVERETAVPDVFEHARLEVRRMDGTTR